VSNYKALAINEPSDATFKRVADVLLRLQAYQALSQFCEDIIQKIESRKPNLKALALKNQAVAFMASGDVEKSTAAFESAFAICPRDENILRPYLSVLEEQGNINEYLNVSRTLIDIDPADVSYYIIYIEALIKRGTFHEALEWIESAKNLPMTQIESARLRQCERKVLAAAALPPSADATPPRTFDLKSAAVA